MSTVNSTPESGLKEKAKTTMPTYADPAGMRHFWLRRLHSAMGLIFGGYVTVHLLVNATGWFPMIFQQNVDKIHQLEPMLPIIEILAIFGPLLFHAVYGAYVASSGLKMNTMQYNYGGNVRYFLQRVTAWILIAFVIYHVGTLHKWGFAMIGLMKEPAFNAHNEAYMSTAKAIKAPYDNMVLNVAVIIFYLLGTWSAAFHWANGLWTSAIAWGVTTTAKSQKRWGHVCCGFGIFMMIVGATAWSAFAIAGDVNKKTPTLPPMVGEAVHGQATPGKSLPDVFPTTVPEKH